MVPAFKHAVWMFLDSTWWAVSGSCPLVCLSSTGLSFFSVINLICYLRMWQAISLFLLSSYYTFLKDAPLMAVIALLLYVSCYQVEESTFLFFFFCNIFVFLYMQYYNLSVTLTKFYCLILHVLSPVLSVIWTQCVLGKRFFFFGIINSNFLYSHLYRSWCPYGVAQTAWPIDKYVCCWRFKSACYEYTSLKTLLFYLAWISSKMCLNH